VGLTTTLQPGEARLFSEQERLEGSFFLVAGGEAAVFSTRNPARNTPNEDTAGVIATAEDCAILAVADGLGGAPAGQQASAVALTCLVEAVRHAMREGHDARWGILNGFEKANEKVLGLGVGAATTLAVAEISERAVRAYHVGDSLVLVTGQRGRTKLQTIPHSPVGYGVESGLLDEKDAMHHDERHVISNAIGTSDMRIDVGLPVELARRDTLLLASDGLTDNLHTDEIVGTVRTGPLGQTTRRLAERALGRMVSGGQDEPSKPDDLTFVIFRLAGKRR
jgi:serine/threonine protein phosphatase PrpC